MRAIIAILGCWLCALAAGPAFGAGTAGAGKPKVYALVAAMGDQFSVVYEVPSTGTHLDPYRRSSLQATDNLLNRIMLRSLDKAVADIDPHSKRILMAIATPGLDDVAPSLREGAAFARAMAQLRNMPQRQEWDRIVVVTPAYSVAKREGIADRLQGVGLFTEPLCQSDPVSCANGFRPHDGPIAVTPLNTKIKTNYYVAPFSYITVRVLDPATLAVLDTQTSFNSEKLFDPSSDAVDLNRNVGNWFLAATIGKLADLSVREAVMHSELRGEVRVNEGKPVAPDERGK